MKTGEPVISVIMPVYNGVKYIEAAVNSVLAQTFHDFELILVDDGASDGSGVLCDKLGMKDCRIRVFHKENQGVSAARNMGMRYAKGKYLAFIDHDDCYLPEFLQKMLEMAESCDVQLIKCGRWDRFLDEKESFRYSMICCNERREIMDNAEFAKEYLRFKQKNERMLASVWNGLYLKSFIDRHRILFPEAFIYGFEDISFNYQCFLAGANIAFLPDVLYVHSIRSNQSTSAGFYPEWLSLKLAVYELEKSFIRREAEGALEILNYFEAEQCMSILKRMKDAEERKRGFEDMKSRLPLNRHPPFHYFRCLGERRMLRWWMLYLHIYKAYDWI